MIYKFDNLLWLSYEKWYLLSLQRTAGRTLTSRQKCDLATLSLGDVCQLTWDIIFGEPTLPPDGKDMARTVQQQSWRGSSSLFPRRKTCSIRSSCYRWYFSPPSQAAQTEWQLQLRRRDSKNVSRSQNEEQMIQLVFGYREKGSRLTGLLTCRWISIGKYCSGVYLHLKLMEPGRGRGH